MITLQITEATAHRLMALCEKDIKDIGARLATAGRTGLSQAQQELRAIAGLIANLEAAGVSTRPSPPPAAAQPESSVTEPAVETAGPAASIDPAAEPDDAPPPAVIAARAKSNGANGKQKFIRTGGGVADADASSGP